MILPESNVNKWAKWIEGLIEEIVDGTHSYHVNSDGVTYRINRQDLNKSCLTSTNQDHHNQHANVSYRLNRVRKQLKWMTYHITS